MFQAMQTSSDRRVKVWGFVMNKHGSIAECFLKQEGERFRFNIRVRIVDVPGSGWCKVAACSWSRLRTKNVALAVGNCEE